MLNVIIPCQAKAINPLFSNTVCDHHETALKMPHALKFEKLTIIACNQESLESKIGDIAPTLQGLSAIFA